MQSEKSTSTMIKAIVLTFDKNLPATLHMIKKYEMLWPNHPFIFHVPYQKQLPPQNKRIVGIESPKEIKATVLKLLGDIPDHEMIYWCIDDKYPEKLDVKSISKLYEEIIAKDNKEIDGILFSSRNFKNKLQAGTSKKPMTVSDILLYPIKDWRNIWLHQFIRAGIIKDIFNQFPEHIAAAKEMDTIKKKVNYHSINNLYCSALNLGFYGESMSRGKLTKNCFESMKKMGITKGDLMVNQNQYYYIGYPLKWKLKWEYLKYFAAKLNWAIRKKLM